MRYLILSILLPFLVVVQSSCQTPNTQAMEQIIDNFVKASHNNLSYQNGINVFIDPPKDDKDALQKGFQFAHYDAEQNGGWEILAAKDVLIEEEQFRAVLYTYQEKQFIVLYRPDKDNQYYFRIFNAVYGQ